MSHRRLFGTASSGPPVEAEWSEELVPDSCDSVMPFLIQLCVVLFCVSLGIYLLSLMIWLDRPGVQDVQMMRKSWSLFTSSLESGICLAWLSFFYSSIPPGREREAQSLDIVFFRVDRITLSILCRHADPPDSHTFIQRLQFAGSTVQPFLRDCCDHASPVLQVFSRRFSHPTT